MRSESRVSALLNQSTRSNSVTALELPSRLVSWPKLNQTIPVVVAGTVDAFDGIVVKQVKPSLVPSSNR